MPGTPATSPNLGIARYANADSVDFAGQVNAITDRLDIIVQRAGTYAARPAASATLNGLRYWATDKWMEFQMIAGAWELLRAEPQPWSSATLPTSPVEGQRITFDAGSGVRWVFRYNSSSTYWDCEGGTELVADVVGPNAVASTTFAAIPGGPTLTVPLIGDWLIDLAVEINPLSAVAIVSYAVGATAASEADRVGGGTSVTGGWDGSVARPSRVKAIATAGTVLTMHAHGSGTAVSISYYNRVLTAMPRRVK